MITVSTFDDITVLGQSLDELSEGGRKMTIVQRRTEHGSYAFLVEYNIKDEQMYRRELNALRLLKGEYTSNCK